MSVSKGSAQWTGNIKGKGVMKPENAPDAPFSLGTRFEGVKGTNPEELIGAALSGCFSMALSIGLEGAGAKPESIHTVAEVKLDKQGAGFAITEIVLTSKVVAPGIDDAKFQTVADETKKGCPVSKALAGTKITLHASLGK